MDDPKSTYNYRHADCCIHCHFYYWNLSWCEILNDTVAKYGVCDKFMKELVDDQKS